MNVDESSTCSSLSQSSFQPPTLTALPLILLTLFLLFILLFLQLEDDIVAKPNYFATMKNFALQLSSEDWMILEFSQLGFIGTVNKMPALNKHQLDFVLSFTNGNILMYPAETLYF